MDIITQIPVALEWRRVIPWWEGGLRQVRTFLSLTEFAFEAARLSMRGKEGIIARLCTSQHPSQA